MLPRTFAAPRTTPPAITGQPRRISIPTRASKASGKRSPAIGPFTRRQRLAHLRLRIRCRATTTANDGGYRRPAFVDGVLQTRCPHMWVSGYGATLRGQNCRRLTPSHISLRRAVGRASGALKRRTTLLMKYLPALETSPSDAPNAGLEK